MKCFITIYLILFLPVPQTENGSGQTPDEPDINLNPVFDKLEPSNTDFEDMESFDKQTQDSDFDRNPLFVVVDHELATPDGIEGPVPVYVKPDATDLNNSLSNMTINGTSFEMDLVNSIKSKMFCT